MVRRWFRNLRERNSYGDLNQYKKEDVLWALQEELHQLRRQMNDQTNNTGSRYYVHGQGSFDNRDMELKTCDDDDDFKNERDGAVLVDDDDVVDKNSLCSSIRPDATVNYYWSQATPDESISRCQTSNSCNSFENWEAFVQDHVALNVPTLPPVECHQTFRSSHQCDSTSISDHHDPFCTSLNHATTREFLPAMPSGRDCNVFPNYGELAAPCNNGCLPRTSNETTKEYRTLYYADVPANKRLVELSKANRNLLAEPEPLPSKKFCKVNSNTKSTQKPDNPTDLMHMLNLMEKVSTFLADRPNHNTSQLLSISALLQRVDFKLKGWGGKEKKGDFEQQPPSSDSTGKKVGFEQKPQPQDNTEGDGLLIGADPTALREYTYKLIDQILDVTEQYMPETLRGDSDNMTLDEDCSTLADDMSFDDSLDTLSYSLSLNDSITISYAADDGNEDSSMTIPSIRSFIQVDDDTLTFDYSSVSKQVDSREGATKVCRQDDTFEDEVVYGRSFGKVESGQRSESLGSSKTMGMNQKHLRNRLSLACCIVGAKPPLIQGDYRDDIKKSQKSGRSVSTTKSSSTLNLDLTDSDRKRSVSTTKSSSKMNLDLVDSDRKKKEFVKKLKQISSKHGGYIGRSSRRHSTAREPKGKDLGEHPLPLIYLRPIERDHSLLSTGFPEEDEADYGNGGLLGTANSFDHWTDHLTITEVDSYENPWDRRLDTASF